jgi:hypothetical protein
LEGQIPSINVMFLLSISTPFTASVVEEFSPLSEQQQAKVA